VPTTVVPEARRLARRGHVGDDGLTAQERFATARRYLEESNRPIPESVMHLVRERLLAERADLA